MSAAANRGALKRKVSAAGFIIDCLEGLDASDALDVLDEVRFALLGELPNEGEPDETIVSELKLDPLAGSSDALDTEDEREPTTAERVAAIVALESTIITHGMPWPQNLEMAREVEGDIRAAGATPATIAILNGTLCIGLKAILQACIQGIAGKSFTGRYSQGIDRTRHK